MSEASLRPPLPDQLTLTRFVFLAPGTGQEMTVVAKDLDRAWGKLEAIHGGQLDRSDWQLTSSRTVPVCRGCRRVTAVYPGGFCGDCNSRPRRSRL